MARRKNKNVVDALFDIAAVLPWWAGVVIAIVTYFVCHAFATAEVAAAKTAAEFAPAIQQTIIKALASLGQYIFPMIFLAGAAASAYRQAKRGRRSPAKEESPASFGARQPREERTEPAIMFPDQHEADIYPIYIWRSDPSENVPPIPVDTTRCSAELLSALEWKRFEMVCAGLFERLGFAARLGTTGPDGGVDIHLSRQAGGPAVLIVQCKAWTSARRVGVDKIRELHGVMASLKLAEGIFVTTTTFTDDARGYAKANGIDLMDGTAVLDSILKLPETHQQSLLQLATAGDYTTPTCASCSVKMRRREPKAGGKPFWGCVNYPRCKSIINMAKA